MTIRFLDMFSHFLLIVAGGVCAFQSASIDLVDDLSPNDYVRVTVYVLLGAAAVYQIVQWRQIRKWMKSK